MPVTASKSLIPTFFNPLSARRYVLVLHIAIDEIHHDDIILEIPVQIIFDYSQPTAHLKRAPSGTGISDLDFDRYPWRAEDEAQFA